ncbi:MAG: hypothetical protein LBC33_01930 [Mycoplasmataceae bacterium]|nr:hypothetical protein [Mycoplasmataceae bacterium]
MLLVIIGSLVTLLYFIPATIHARLFTVGLTIKRRFNNLSVFIENVSFKHLEAYAKNQPEISALYRFLNTQRDEIKKNLELIKNKILLLNQINRCYNFFSAYKLTKNIKSDLSSLERIQQILSISCSNSNDFYNAISAISLSLFETQNAIREFYDRRLYVKYRNDEYAVLIKTIKKQCQSINDVKNTIDYQSFIEQIFNASKNIEHLLSLVIPTYLSSQMIEHLLSLYRSIEQDPLEAKITDQNELKTINSLKIKGYEILAELKDATEKLDEAKVRSNLRDAALNLQGAKNRIDIYLKSNELVNNDLHLIAEKLSAIYQENDHIFNNLSVIQSDFLTKNKKIAVTLDDIRNRTTQIIKTIKKSIDPNYLGTLNRSDTLTLYYQLLTELRKWKNDISQALNDINVKVNEFINLNDQISELRIWCYYLKNNKMEFHSPNQKAVVNFDYLINEIDLLAEKIKNNFENVYEGVKTELDDIAREVKYYVEHQYIDWSIYEFAKRLTFFANKYRYEATEISSRLEKIDQLNAQHEYHHSIDELIQLLAIIKESCAKNKVAFR